VSENRELRRICGSIREEMKGGWRTMHNEKFHKFYASPDICEDEQMTKGLMG
jgi:hypothetical protein